MSFPASLTTRTVKGRFVTHPDGVAAKGFVRIILSSLMQGPTDDIFVVPFDRIFPLDRDGAFSTVLPATNDPQWTPSFYKVIIATEMQDVIGSDHRYHSPSTGPAKILQGRLEVPYDATTPIDLADVLNVPAATPGQIYIVSSQRGVPGGIATLGDDGKINPSQLPPSAGGDVEWGSVLDKPTTFPPSTHDHVIGEVAGLTTALSDKASASDLTSGLAAKANTSHTHATSQVTGLDAALLSKVDESELTSALGTKADTVHTHTTGQVTGLDTALSSKVSESELTSGLAGKSDTGHTHAFSAITGKPDTYPHDPIQWADIQGKPAPGETAPVEWTDVQNKPTTFPSNGTISSDLIVSGYSALHGVTVGNDLVVDGYTSLHGVSIAGDLEVPNLHVIGATILDGSVTGIDVSDIAGLSTTLSTKADLVGGVIPTSQIPSISQIDFLGSVSTQAAMLALVGQKGDYCIRTDLGQQWIITSTDTTLLSSWTAMPTGTSPVQTVNGQTGNVVLAKADVGLGNVTNTSDANKPVSTAQQTALDLKAPLASPTFTGTVSGVTASMVGLGSVNNTADSAKPISTAQQAALDAKAPLASPTFTGTVSGITSTMVGLGSVNNTSDTAKPISTATQTALDAKAPLASPTLTGTPTAPTPTAGDNTTKLATTAFVTTAVAGVSGGGGTGNVTGPVSATSTDNALVRWDGTTGKLVQDSLFNATDAGTLILTPLAAQAYVRGQLQYDSDNETLSFHNNDSSIAVKMGQDVLVRVWNSTGSTIAKGVPVYASGLDATSGFPTVALATASGILGAHCLGFSAESIVTGASGWVLVSGVISGLNTSTITAGNSVYLSTTAGVISASPATAPNFRVPVGFVLASSTTVGKMLVRPSGPPQMGFGTANQILGMNTGASSQEYKTVNGTANQVTVTHGTNAITLSIPSAAALPGAPTTTTPTAGDNTTKIATTAFVTTAVAASAAGAASSVDGGLALFSGTTGKALKTTAVGIDTNADMSGLRRLTRTLTADPAVTGLDQLNLNYTVTTSTSDLERIYVNTVLTTWRNEVGFLRGTPHSGYKDDALLRAVPRSDLTTENGGFIELQNPARTQVVYKRDWRTGSLWRGDGTAAAIKMADSLVLSAAASVPAGTPAGTLIFRTAT